NKKRCTTSGRSVGVDFTESASECGDNPALPHALRRGSVITPPTFRRSAVAPRPQSIFVTFRVRFAGTVCKAPHESVPWRSLDSPQGGWLGGQMRRTLGARCMRRDRSADFYSSRSRFSAAPALNQAICSPLKL